MRLTRCVRSYFILVAGLSCARPAAYQEPRVQPANRQETDSCLTPTDSQVATVPIDTMDTSSSGIISGLRRHGRFVTVLIDNQRAVWNQPVDSLPAFEDLDPSDVESIQLWWPGQTPAAFSICPGVSLMSIITKSKTWHPSHAH